MTRAIDGRTARWLSAAVLAAMCATLGSACNIVGPLPYIISGPEKAEAMYVLPEDKSAVVFIDDRSSKLPDMYTRRAIGRAADDRILEEKLVAKLISSESAMMIASRERYGSPLGIAEIGKAAGADIIIYVTVDQFTLYADPQTPSPSATVRIKVVDTTTKARLWPTGDAEWSSLKVSSRSRVEKVHTSTAAIQADNTNLAQGLGYGIAKTFYKHEIKPIGQDADQRFTEQRG
ncbi:MAG: hypothetical protein KF745_04485 [Phycisphaeraceae bacterium]|nr:hypothetical protein [Phycisphaeraceae bacterium]